MPQHLDHCEIDFLLGSEQNAVNIDGNQPKLSKKRTQLAERIANCDDLVRQLKQLQNNQQQLDDLKRTAGEVTELYQSEKQQREQLQRCLSERSQRCTELEHQLDVQQLNCEQLQEQLKLRALPVDAKDMVSVFMQLAQRVGGEDATASGLLRREHNLLRKLKDYCKSAKISIPAAAPRSPAGKRSKATTTATQTTETLPSKPVMCSIATQSENLVTTRNQGTQHKNMTTTRGTTTASFIRKHDVGTCFPEPKAPMSVQQILSDMLTWSSSIQRPLSPIGDLLPEPDVVETTSLGTCTELCNVLRQIDYLPEMPAELKRSNSRPPSRASVKDELGGYGQHMAKELLNILPHNQSVLTDLPPHVFNEIWQVMGQMVLVVLQRRSTNAAPPPTISQADFSSWFDALHESSLHSAMSSNKDHAELDVPVEETVGGIDVGTDPIMMPPPVVVGSDLTPIRLPVKPKFRMKARVKAKPKKRRRVVFKMKRKQSKSNGNSDSESVCKAVDTAESAVYFLSNLNVFKSPNCDISDIQLDPEEQRLLQMTSAAENVEQPPATKSTSAQHQIECNFDNTENLDGNQQIPQKPNNSAQSTATILVENADESQFLLLEDTETLLWRNPSTSSRQVPIETQPYEEQPTQLEDAENRITNSSQKSEKHSKVEVATQSNDGQIILKEVPTENKLPSSYQAEQITNTLVGIKVNSNSEQSTARNQDQLPTISTTSSHCNQLEYTLKKDKTAEHEQKATEDLSQCMFSASSYKSQINSLFGSDEDSDEAPLEEDLSSNSLLTPDKADSGSSCNGQLNLLPQTEENRDVEQPAHEESTSQAVDNSLIDSDDEQSQLLIDTADLQQFSPVSPTFKCQQLSSLDNIEEICPEQHVNCSDLESVESGYGLVIDDGNLLEDDADCHNEATEYTTSAFVAIQPAPAIKRKRKASSSSSLELQPVEKRLTRYQAKQLLLESARNVNVEDSNSLNATKETQSSCTTYSSPMSPAAAEECEDSDCCEPIEIPLHAPGAEQNSSEPKALLSYVVNGVKAVAKQCAKRQQLQQQLNQSQKDQLKLRLMNHMINSKALDGLCFEHLKRDEAVAFDIIINAYGANEVKIEDGSALERLLLVVRQINFQNNSTVQGLLNVLEQRLFTLKERLNTQMSHKYLRLHLHLIDMQRSLTMPGQSFVNPARLLLAKILYHYKNDMTLLVLEVLNHFPTVLPYREERDYNHSDPLITVIKHLLMGHKYEVQDAQGADRELLSKLRFQYHYQPFEPTKQQVIENLVEKLKAGRLDQLCYAFALFCRRATPTQVIKSVLEAQLLPLANSYCDLCMQSEEYDARMEVLLQSISMIVKQMPLGQQINIVSYIALFQRILLAVPRPGVQQAAVQAILRTQRFGYGFALDALQSYRPNYQLTPMTRAMMRSYAERRRQYQLQKKGPKIVNGKQSIR